ncbi:MAG: mannose-6-phosphate isomerase, class I [Treponema sp.]|nr:mannose-6-phosphate isomerase, class I [Treponema sp.]
MTKVYKLHNQIKHYEWGSPYLLPQFLGFENNEGTPCAEMWMGTHSEAPSTAQYGEKQVNLAEISGELAFLFKLLAIEKPLSIQAHPNKEQAVEGFLRENKTGIALNSHRRNYKDDNHKPEVICALSHFTLMAGFRKTDEIYASVETLLSIAPRLKDTLSSMLRVLESGHLAAFFGVLFGLSSIQRKYLSTIISEKETGETESISPEQWELIKRFAAQFPEDPAILSPLYLNLITLQIGQAVFVPAGILHSYISGFGIELMTSSDNVLRGGLTRKYTDISELMNILDFNPYVPPVYTPDSPAWFCYQTPCNEFLLAFMRGDGGEKVFPVKEAAICIVTEGELKIGGMVFKKGESFFIPQNKDTELLSFSGNYSLFAAYGGTAAHAASL